MILYKVTPCTPLREGLVGVLLFGFLIKSLIATPFRVRPPTIIPDLNQGSFFPDPYRTSRTNGCHITAGFWGYVLAFSFLYAISDIRAFIGPTRPNSEARRRFTTLIHQQTTLEVAPPLGVWFHKIALVLSRYTTLSGFTAFDSAFL